MEDFEENRVWKVLSIDDEQSVHDTYRAILCEDELGTELDDLFDVISSQKKTDSSEMRYHLDNELSGQAGFQRVEQALEAGDPYVVGFIDMRMPPGWDGLKTAEMIRQIDPDVRIILITAYADYELSEIRERIGDDFVFMNKPVTQNELLQITSLFVKQWFNAHENRTNNIEEDGSLSPSADSLFDHDDETFNVLLVDSSPTILAVYGFLLKRNPHCIVEVAEGVDEALERMQTFIPDLAIVDYFMPQKEGLILIKELLQQEAQNAVLSFFIHKSEEKLVEYESDLIEVLYKDDPTEVFLHRIGSMLQTFYTRRALHSIQNQATTPVKKTEQVEQKPFDTYRRLLLLESILDSVPEILLVVGSDQKISYANRTAVHQLGYELDQLNGMALSGLMDWNSPREGREERQLQCQDARNIPVVVSSYTLNGGGDAEGELLVCYLSDRHLGG